MDCDQAETIRVTLLVVLTQSPETEWDSNGHSSFRLKILGDRKIDSLKAAVLEKQKVTALEKIVQKRRREVAQQGGYRLKSFSFSVFDYSEITEHFTWAGLRGFLLLSTERSVRHLFCSKEDLRRFNRIMRLWVFSMKHTHALSFQINWKRIMGPEPSLLLFLFFFLLVNDSTFSRRRRLTWNLSSGF